MASVKSVGIHRRLIIKDIRYVPLTTDLIGKIEDIIYFSNFIKNNIIDEILVDIIEAFMKVQHQLPTLYISHIEKESYNKLLTSGEATSLIDSTTIFRFRSDIDEICTRSKPILINIIHLHTFDGFKYNDKYFEGKSYILQNLYHFEYEFQNWTCEEYRDDTEILIKSAKARYIFNILYNSPRGLSNYPVLQDELFTII